MSEITLIERLRDMANPERVGSHFHPLYGEAANEIERLRKGIQDYLDGNYENPRQHRPDLDACKHGMPWYSECITCDCEHFIALLSDTPAVREMNQQLTDVQDSSGDHNSK